MSGKNQAQKLRSNPGENSLKMTDGHFVVLHLCAQTENHIKCKTGLIFQVGMVGFFQELWSARFAGTNPPELSENTAILEAHKKKESDRWRSMMPRYQYAKTC